MQFNDSISIWHRVVDTTPIWVKEAITVSIGVLGGLTLFQMVKSRIKVKV